MSNDTRATIVVSHPPRLRTDAIQLADWPQPPAPDDLVALDGQNPRSPPCSAAVITELGRRPLGAHRAELGEGRIRSESAVSGRVDGVQGDPALGVVVQTPAEGLGQRRCPQAGARLGEVLRPQPV